MTDSAEHLGAALESLGHTVPDEALASAVELARTREAEQAAAKFISTVMERPRTAPDPILAERYRQLLEAAKEATPSLEDFRAMEAYDSNVWWRLDCGHHQNLLDAALEEIDALQAALIRLTAETPRKDTA